MRSTWAHFTSPAVHDWLDILAPSTRREGASGSRQGAGQTARTLRTDWATSPSRWLPLLHQLRLEAANPDGLFEGIEIDESDLCVGTYAGGDVPCHGDSGGPLFAWTGAGQTLVGVTNTSNPICALPLQPAVFGRVSAAAGWIAGIASGVRFVSPAALIGVATPIVI